LSAKSCTERVPQADPAAAGRVRVGIIGCGGMGGTHAAAYQSDGRAELVAFVDVERARARQLAKKFGGRAYTELAEMLERQRPEAVSICTPPNSHMEAALAGSKATAHVLCEKPLAMTAAQARRMTAAAKRSRRLLLTGFRHRFYGPVVGAKELIDSGKLGDILMFRNRFAGLIDMQGRWFGDKKVSGGGSIIDTSIHSIDLFRFLVGEPSLVAACSATLGQNIEVEDSSAILLQTAEGAIGVIEACWSSPFSDSVIQIYGSKGAAFVDYSRGELRHRSGDMKRWRAARFPEATFQSEVSHFLDCVLGLASPIVTGEDGLRAMMIADAAYRSVRRGTWEAV
jgi:predicted dehydrogenase